MEGNGLLREIMDLSVYDTHEHYNFGESREIDLPGFVARSYLGTDLQAVGMDLDAFDKIKDAHDRWRALSPHLRGVWNTSYHHYVQRSLESILGLEGHLTDDNWERYDSQFKSLVSKPGWADECLDRARIKHILNDPYWDSFDAEAPVSRASPVLRVNALVLGAGTGATDHNDLSGYNKAKEMGLPLDRLDDYEDFVSNEMERFMRAGSRTAKSAMAYDRIIKFDHVPRSLAEKAYEKGTRASFAERKNMEDYLFHYILLECGERDLPMQIHTGILAGVGAIPTDAHPNMLDDVVKQYPDTRFDLFHGGYPYMSELTIMAKVYRNVYLDLCWLPLISRTACERCLNEWLDTFSHRKIFWGGDVGTPEHTVGAVTVAKEAVCSVLEDRIERKILDRADALDVARSIFYENACDFFGKHHAA